MEHTYDELHKKTLAQLREIAQGIEHPAVQGYTQLHKQDLLTALCTALGVEMHVHHEVVGIDKAKIKAQIRKLKVDRDKALKARKGAQLKKVRREIHHLKHQLRKAMD